MQRERKRALSLMRKLTGETVGDYEFTSIGRTGKLKKTKLSHLFGKHNELIVIHNRGKGYVYCTLWADGFNGLVPHFENRAGYVVVSPDDPKTQREFA